LKKVLQNDPKTNDEVIMEMYQEISMQYVLGFVLQTVTSPFVSLTLYRTTAPFVCGQVPKRISGDNQLSVSGQ